jgi:hypothetical protein
MSPPSKAKLRKPSTPEARMPITISGQIIGGKLVLGGYGTPDCYFTETSVVVMPGMTR